MSAFVKHRWHFKSTIMYLQYSDFKLGKIDTTTPKLGLKSRSKVLVQLIIIILWAVLPSWCKFVLRT